MSKKMHIDVNSDVKKELSNIIETEVKYDAENILDINIIKCNSSLDSPTHTNGGGVSFSNGGKCAADIPPPGVQPMTSTTGRTSGLSFNDGDTKDKTKATFDWKPYIYQIKLAMLVCIGTLSAGAILAFPSVLISDLELNPYTIYGNSLTLTNTQKDLVASAAYVGGVVGVAICGVTVSRFGRKPVLTGLGLIAIVSWIGVALAPSAWMLLLFRGISGVAYGGFNMSVMAYIVEISDEVIRGPMTLIVAVMAILGQVISVIPAYWLRYYEVVFFDCVFPSVFFIVSIIFLPESPSALVIKGSEDKARKILKKLRPSDADIGKEIQEYKDLNKLHMDTNLWRSLTQRDVLIRFGIVYTLFIIQVFSGYTTFTAQTARILQDSGSTLESTVATILVQFSQLGGVVCSMLFVQRVGRRGSLLASHVVTGVSLAALATFMLLYDAGSANGDETSGNATSTVTIDQENDRSMGWVPLACIMTSQFGCSLGMQSVPFIFASEYFPTSIRPQSAAICVCFGTALGVISLQLYTPLQQLVTQTGVLYINSGFSLLAVPFSYFVVQETVGRQVG